MGMRIQAAAAAILTAVLASPALAQDDGGWDVSVTPYLWLPTISGSGQTGRGTPIDVKTDFEDVFDSLSGAFVGKAEARYDRIGGLVDLQYVKVSGDNQLVINNVPRLSSEVEVETMGATAALYYRAYASETVTFDVLAGVRYNSVDVEFDIARIGFPGVSRDISVDLWDPIIGARATAHVAERWSLTGYGDVGGGGDSDAVWQVLGTVNYHASENWLLHGGYRYYAVDVSERGHELELRMHGPIFAATYRF
ncbi:hypothetical protein ACFODL_17900 [Phenylobacterium terrae]|uniref:Outer membrane protein beta-barrel domain-containing protein n=1 Tax=Phenylobacterium terrae TaxID=2665495 RepID=A0ABW4N2L6_9CAUL